MSHRILFPATGMACPESRCQTPVFTRYEGLVIHWKTVHNSTVELYSCQMCGRQYKRRTDANRHLRQVHNGGISVNRVRNRDYIPAQGEIPRKPPAVTSTPTSTDVTSPVNRQQARMEAQADRQRIKEEAERGQAVAMTNRDLDNVFQEDRFTLMSAEPDVLDYE